MKIGKKVRQLRREKGMTLKELSERSGVALATLSRIETERMTGTVESHMRVAEALGLSLPQLYVGLQAAEKKPTVDVHARGKAADVFVHNEKSSFEMLTGQVLSKKMMPVLIRIGSGGITHSEENQRGTEKFLYVLEGKMEIQVGQGRYTLSRGDSLYFDGSVPHRCRNLASSEARCLCIVTPPAL